MPARVADDRGDGRARQARRRLGHPASPRRSSRRPTAHGRRPTPNGAFTWTEDAVARLNRVPAGFMRDMTREEIEKVAREKQVGFIDLAVCEEGIGHARADDERGHRRLHLEQEAALDAAARARVGTAGPATDAGSRGRADGVDGSMRLRCLRGAGGAPGDRRSAAPTDPAGRMRSRRPRDGSLRDPSSSWLTPLTLLARRPPSVASGVAVHGVRRLVESHPAVQSRLRPLLHVGAPGAVRAASCRPRSAGG